MVTSQPRRRGRAKLDASPTDSRVKQKLAPARCHRREAAVAEVADGAVPAESDRYWKIDVAALSSAQWRAAAARRRVSYRVIVSKRHLPMTKSGGEYESAGGAAEIARGTVQVPAANGRLLRQKMSTCRA